MNTNSRISTLSKILLVLAALCLATNIYLICLHLSILKDWYC